MKKHKKTVMLSVLVFITVSILVLSGCSASEAPAQTDADRETLYQVSLLQGLMLGDYEGSVSVAELKAMGDTGIGTFNALNGELIMTDGIVYRAAENGEIEVVPDDETIPFANVTFFDNDTEQELTDVSDFDALRGVLNKAVEQFGENRFYMIRIDGTFKEMHVRSEKKQSVPYQPLAKVLETDQTFFDYENIDGTVVGLYCPAFMDRLNAAGWHLHFVSADKKKGGHVLELSVGTATLSWDHTPGFSMLLPDNASFAAFDLTADQSEDIKKVETGE